MIPGKIRKSWLAGRVDSFRFAFRGLGTVMGSQHNFRIHLCITIVVIVAGFFARLSLTEWCIIMLTIALVLSLEAINTALESLVDIISPEYHVAAGKAKDIAAGAVLVAAFTALVIGIIIFGARFIDLLNVNQ